METTQETKSKEKTSNLPPAGQTWQRLIVGAEFRPFLRFGIFAGVLGLIYIIPLLGLARLAWTKEVHSHILAMPVIVAYLMRVRLNDLSLRWVSALGWSAVSFLAGTVAIGTHLWMLQNGWRPHGADQITLPILSFYFFLLSGAFTFWGKDLSRSLIFPLGMLIFIVPIPGLVETSLETFLQQASAEATDLFLTLSGTPVFRAGLKFILPNLTIEVARECSGIHSTLILFITGLIASNLFLRTPWKRGLFVVLTVPLGILRNAFRIFVLAMLTVHVNPNIINSALHSRGGPLFFAVSLLPLFGLLILLNRSERRAQTKSTGNSNVPKS